MNNIEKYYKRNFNDVIDHVCSGDQFQIHDDDMNPNDISYDDGEVQGQSASSPRSSPRFSPRSSPSIQSKSRKKIYQQQQKVIINNNTNGILQQWNKYKERLDSKSWIGRQIEAAYEEHATIINKLREELEESKEREQALIQEFSNKFQDLKIQQRNNGGNPLTMEQMVQVLEKSKKTADDEDDEDMPMDEMTHNVKLERNARARELYEQHLAMDRLKKESDEKIEKMRKQCEIDIKTIEKALKEKVLEIDQLKKEAQNFKNQTAKKQLAAGTVSPNVSNSSDSSDDSIPIHSFMLQEHSTPSPDSKLIPDISLIESMRLANIDSPHSLKKKINFEDSAVPIDKSNIESHISLMNKLTQAFEVTMSIDENSKVGKLSQVQNLNQNEVNFIKTISKMFRTIYKRETKEITGLKAKLEESNKEIQKSASKTSEMSIQMKQLEDEIKHLQHQLNSAHDSIRNTSNLEDMLKMMSNDRISTEMAEGEYILKLEEIKHEKEALAKERKELQDEAEKSVSAIQRVMADVTNAKDEEIESLRKEIQLLKLKADPTSEKTDFVKPVTIEQYELTQLREKVKESEEAQAELSKLLSEKTKIDTDTNKDVEKQMTKLKNELDVARNENEELKSLLNDEKDAVENAKNDNEEAILLLTTEKESLQQKVREMVKEIEGHKNEIKNVKDNMIQAKKVAHEREHTLEVELSELRTLQENAMKKENSLKTQLHAEEEKVSDLQSKIISIKEEKLELKTRLRKAEQSDSTSLATLEAQKKTIRDELELELKNERDQELAIIDSELALVKKKNDEYKKLLSKKDDEMNILRSSLKVSSYGYISGDDDSDVDDDVVATKIPLHDQKQLEELAELRNAKEKAENEAKENAERLANAKMIISSLEQSKKSMIEDLKSRLHDSNSAIVSLLDQSGRHEKESAELKTELQQLKSQKDAIEKQLNEMKKNNHLSDLDSPADEESLSLSETATQSSESNSEIDTSAKKLDQMSENEGTEKEEEYLIITS